MMPFLSLSFLSCCTLINTKDPGKVSEPEIPDPPITPPIENKGGKALRVNGNLIEYGADGEYKTVVLRGVNVGDLYHFSKNRFFRPPDYNRIAQSLNANCIRIAVHPNLWRNEKLHVLACLKENVRDALAANLFIIVDYHTIGFPNGYVQFLNDGVISYDSDFNLAKDFWDTISREITDGRVLYELWNEPASSANVYYDTRHWGNLKPWWETLMGIIRNNGSENICIAGGDVWTHELRGIKGNPIQDGNTAYAWHLYANEMNNSPAEWEEKLDGLYNVRPVLVTEWGYSTVAGADEYAPESVFADKFVNDFLINRNLHSMAWGYDPYYTPSMLVNGEYNRLNRFGQYVVDYLTSTLQEFPD